VSASSISTPILAGSMLITVVALCATTKRDSVKPVAFEQEQAIYKKLRERKQPLPDALEVKGEFLEARYYILKPLVQSEAKDLTENCILAIREAMTPFERPNNYRVLVGWEDALSKRHTSIARYTHAAKFVEWEVFE
jgi:hypothetical protein